MAKHQSNKGGAFKSWKEAADTMDSIMDRLSEDLSIRPEDRTGIVLGIELARFRFRLELTVFEQKRKKL